MRLLLISLVCLAASGCDELAAKARAPSVPAAPPANEAFTQRYPSKNGLVVAHYPPSFAAKSQSDNVLLLSRNLGDGDDEAVVFVSLPNPITDDTHEFARVVMDASGKKYPNYVEQQRKDGTCHGNPAVVRSGTWHNDGSEHGYTQWGCAFVRNGRGYSFSFSVPTARESTEALLMKSIIERVDLVDRAGVAGADPAAE